MYLFLVKPMSWYFTIFCVNLFSIEKTCGKFRNCNNNLLNGRVNLYLDEESSTNQKQLEIHTYVFFKDLYSRDYLYRIPASDQTVNTDFYCNVLRKKHEEKAFKYMAYK